MPLDKKSEPIFKEIFGDAWHSLPLAMRKHYANHAYTDETVTVEGRLKIESSALGRLLFPLLRVLKVLIPREEDNVKTTVHFITKKDSDMFHFDRTMQFADGSTCHFLSSMKPVGGNELVEFMSFGLGWRLAYSWDGEKVILAHRGYVLNVFGFLLPLPLSLLIGKGYAEEVPINETEFSMMTEIRHPLWGKIYGYSGRFSFTEATLNEKQD